MRTLIWRHRRENRKKCSLQGVHHHPNFRFFSYPDQPLPYCPGFVLLGLQAPPLTKEEGFEGIALLDGTWKYVEKMRQAMPNREKWVVRSLPPHFATAYPRKQEDCPQPSQGLASIEAIYVAYHILGWDPSGLLDHYYWREDFLRKNGWKY